jgi:hypothetical protein
MIRTETYAGNQDRIRDVMLPCKTCYTDETLNTFLTCSTPFIIHQQSLVHIKRYKAYDGVSICFISTTQYHIQTMYVSQVGKEHNAQLPTLATEIERKQDRLQRKPEPCKGIIEMLKRLNSFSSVTKKNLHCEKPRRIPYTCIGRSGLPEGGTKMWH